MDKNKTAAPAGFKGPGPMGGTRFGGTPQKPKNFKKTMKKIVGYLRPFWG